VAHNLKRSAFYVVPTNMLYSETTSTMAKLFASLLLASILKMVFFCSLFFSVVTAPVAFTATAASFTYGFAYIRLFSAEEFNVCELKAEHFNPDPTHVVSWYLYPIAQHFWESEYAPVCVDDLEEPAPPTIAPIALDLLQQTGWRPRAEQVVHLANRFLGTPTTIEEICTGADVYLFSLFKQANWYAPATVGTETQPPPTHASVSFRDFMKWSIDYVFDTYHERLTMPSHIGSQFATLLSRIGSGCIASIDRMLYISSTYPSCTFEIPTKFLQAYALWFAREIVNVFLFQVFETLDRLTALRQSNANLLGYLQWLIVACCRWSLCTLGVFFNQFVTVKMCCSCLVILTAALCCYLWMLEKESEELPREPAAKPADEPADEPADKPAEENHCHWCGFLTRNAFWDKHMQFVNNIKIARIEDKWVLMQKWRQWVTNTNALDHTNEEEQDIFRANRDLMLSLNLWLSEESRFKEWKTYSSEQLGENYDASQVDWVQMRRKLLRVFHPDKLMHLTAEQKAVCVEIFQLMSDRIRVPSAAA